MRWLQIIGQTMGKETALPENPFTGSQLVVNWLISYVPTNSLITLKHSYHGWILDQNEDLDL